MKKNILILLLSIFCLITYNNSALAAIYYVDFDNGSDTNSGMSTSTPWRSLPGTYGQTAWGSINSGNKIPVGSTIYIKAGTTYSSADPSAGNILIKTDYYASPTQESQRITITVSPDWGSGHVTINGAGLTYGGDFSAYLLGVRYLSYITIKGNDDSRRLKIINAESSSKWGLFIRGTNATTRSTANKFDYLTIQDCDYGLMVGYTDNFLFDHVLLKDNDHWGISIGAVGDEICNGGTLQNSESDHNGTSGSDTGVQVVGSTNILIKNVVSHDCPARNFDYGTVTNTNTCTVTTVNCVSYNGLDGGFCGNGDTAGTCVYYYINCISYNDNPNNGRGGFHAYNGCTVYYYHCIVDKRTVSGTCVAFSAGTGTDGGIPQGKVDIYAKNNVVYFPAGTGTDRFIWYLYQSAGADIITIKDINYNIYDPTGVTRFARSWITSASPAVQDYTSFSDWKNCIRHTNKPDANSSTSTSIATYWTDVANNNYTITSTLSPLKNAGTYLSAPPYVLTDKAGVIRSNPPTIGPYGYNKEWLSAPSNLRIVPQ